MNSPYTTIGSDFWMEIRTVIGASAGKDANESRNEVGWDLPFYRIDGFGPDSPQAIQNDLRKCFGVNGVAAPRPLEKEIVSHYVVKTAVWLFHRPIDEAEATAMLHDFNKKLGRC